MAAGTQGLAAQRQRQDSRDLTAPQAEGDSWRPLAPALERVLCWLLCVPTPVPGEQIDLLAVRSGDEVEVILQRIGKPAEVLGRFPVIAADGRYFKIRNGRIFDQHRGWPILAGRHSEIIARKAP
jgi:hypothetical protein